MNVIRPVLFTQTGCNDSRKVREWLTVNGLAFIERNVTGDPDAARELATTGYFVTPLLLTDETAVVGFQPRLLADALGLLETAE